MGNNNRIINQRISSRRKALKYSQEEVANHIGIKLSTYSQKERQGNIDCDFLIKISELFDVDIRYFLFGDEKYLELGFLNTSQQETGDRIDGKIPYYLTPNEMCLIKTLAGFPTKYKIKASNYLSCIRKFLEQKKK